MLRAYSQCSNIEQQGRGEGDWFATSSRLSGWKQTLWESQLAEHRSTHREGNHTATEPFTNGGRNRCAPISPQGALHTDGGTQNRVRSSRGLPGYEPNVSRRSPCSGRPVRRRSLHTSDESVEIQDSLQCRWSAYDVRTPLPGAAGGYAGLSGLKISLPPLPPESNRWSRASRTHRSHRS